MEALEYLSSPEGMKFLAFVGGGIIVAGTAIWQVIKHFKSDISASDRSIASGRDVTINVNTDENSSSKK